MDNAAGGPPVTAGTDFPGPGSRVWRPAPALVGLLLGLAALAVVGAFLPREPLDRIVAGVAALALLALAALAHRRRLVAGPRGLLIRTIGGRRLIPWSDVRAGECGRTKRMGSSTLEIDLVDEELLLFGRVELGADPADVAAALAGWFPIGSGPS
ncbi:PH domain-containing protein [Nakamurella sp.]|uniref:PH domain-containing protein n=1 Tax=Nakamurella sp. TaxID=1869182 RepID=UPI003B3BA8D9